MPGCVRQGSAKNKPILIGEMAPADPGGDKAKWIDDIIPTLRIEYPLVKGQPVARIPAD